ncbi:MAG: DUF4468 domain-containing protein [Flavobacterium sp.]|jgi:hypothetical protein|uniref:DUF4468 domain-containing protein n=1 Tax=Flavobacterium sp. TaxID=239 RepID=UPI003BED768E
MKKLLLILMSVSALSNAQETEFTFNSERGMSDFVVANVEGKTAQEIYKKAIEWIKITYKNPDKVILSTIENEYIRFEGSSGSFYSINLGFMGKSYQQTKYQIEISIKDSRYKFDIIGMENYTSPSQYSSGGWSDNTLFNANVTKEYLEKSIYKKDGSLRSAWKNINDVPVYFNDLNKSMLNYIIVSQKKNDGW